MNHNPPGDPAIPVRGQPEDRSSPDRPATGLIREPGPEEESRPKPRGLQKWIWIIIAVVCGVYVFIPEPTDAIPILGWLDEGVAVIIFTYALERLGIRVPLLDRLLHRRRKKR